ncbi:Endoplasmic reticulum vesicle transporter [Carpediemonas membranifera]|uniref:Endoplasmic reticulum vesicle transporter n=1 Tax=Carpediemonas membranifera TaxID=201153 RepID=A0A8J6B0V4_9EUKA|nr:Endoplasmic reticulum vesicle transporter [Carpediemonas membranifera]|eukprot:KAG9393183.1 Endoplasmic reticulum vesicle transporter [Carpediemonas membranifera]
MGLLSQLDLFPKVQYDFVSRTRTGGLITIIAALFITFLVFSQFIEYLSPQYIPQMGVDDKHRTEKIPISIDMTIDNVNCDFLSVDLVDHFSERIDADLEGLKKTTIPAKKSRSAQVSKPSTELPADYCGSCYGAQQYVGQCCNTCDDVKKAYMAKRWTFLHTSSIEQCVREGAIVDIHKVTSQGCHLKGTIKVSKVRGNFHVSPGESYDTPSGHLHDLGLVGINDLDLSHNIREFSIGDAKANKKMGFASPLANTLREDHAGGMCQRYFLQVVPTDLGSAETYQYSVTESASQADGKKSMPGVFFSYDFSPIMVTVTRQRETLFRFLTLSCGIVGGVISVASALTAFFTGGMRMIEKRKLGKL